MATSKQLALRIKYARQTVKSLTKKLNAAKAKAKKLEADLKKAKTAEVKKKVKKKVAPKKKAVAKKKKAAPKRRKKKLRCPASVVGKTGLLRKRCSRLSSARGSKRYS